MGSVESLSEDVLDGEEDTARRCEVSGRAAASIGGSIPTSVCGGVAYCVSSLPVRTIWSGAPVVFESRQRNLLVHLAARRLRSRQMSLEVQRMSYGVGNILSLGGESAFG